MACAKSVPFAARQPTLVFGVKRTPQNTGQSSLCSHRAGIIPHFTHSSSLLLVGLISLQQEREPHCKEELHEEQEAISTVHPKQESLYSAVTRIAEWLDCLKGILENSSRVTKWQ